MILAAEKQISVVHFGLASVHGYTLFFIFQWPAEVEVLLAIKETHYSSLISLEAALCL